MANKAHRGFYFQKIKLIAHKGFEGKKAHQRL